MAGPQHLAAGPGWGSPVPYRPGYGWTPPPQAPKPGIVPLRPLGVGELLEGALGLIRSNPRTVLTLAAVLSLLVGLVQAAGVWASFSALEGSTEQLAGSEVPELADMLSTMAAQTLPSLVAGVVQLLAAGLFIVLVGAAVLGRRLDARQTWEQLRPRLAGLVGIALLLAVGLVVIVGAAAGVIVALVPVLAGWAAIPGVILGLAVACFLVYAYVRLALASPALVMEALGPVAALRRSWALVRGSWWRVLGVQLLAAIVVGLLTAVVTVPVTVLTMALSGLDSGPGPILVGSVVSTVVAGVVTLPFSAAMVGLLYLDLRMRHEMLHVQLAAAAAAPAADPLAVYRR